MLGWFLYFKIAFKFASLVLLTNGSSFEYLEISRFCTILEKKLYLKPRQFLDQFLQVHCFQVNEFHLSATLSDRRSFTFFQNSLLSTTFFSFRFS